MKLPVITSPTLLLNEKKVRRNIRKMAEKAHSNQVIYRPHFKTHQSHEIGQWFREVDVTKITASSLQMAEYFAKDGWNDITVAFPVNILEIDRINNLAERINLNLLVESVEVVEFLKQHLQSKCKLFIKIDCGTGRTGIHYSEQNKISELIDAIHIAQPIHFAGFLTHAGHSYDARGIKEIEKVHQETTKRMVQLKNHFISSHPDLIISVGDTPTCSKADDFSMVDEIRPGNFVFFDLMQALIGSCTIDQVGVVMACPIVALHPERNEMVIHGGSVHFSSDYVTIGSVPKVFGQVIRSDETWDEVVEDAYLTKLSQEHGIVQAPKEVVDQYKIGDIITIIPTHSCSTANLMNEYMTLGGNTINRL